MKKGLDTFFKPKSIAVVGASANSTKIGHAALKNIPVKVGARYPSSATDTRHSQYLILIQS